MNVIEAIKFLEDRDFVVIRKDRVHICESSTRVGYYDLEHSFASVEATIEVEVKLKLSQMVRELVSVHWFENGYVCRGQILFVVGERAEIASKNYQGTAHNLEMAQNDPLSVFARAKKPGS